MITRTMRTRRLGGQQPVDVMLESVPPNEFDKAEVVFSFDGAIEEQRATIGLRPREADRLGRLLIKAAADVK